MLAPYLAHRIAHRCSSLTHQPAQFLVDYDLPLPPHPNSLRQILTAGHVSLQYAVPTLQFAERLLGLLTAEPPMVFNSKTDQYRLLSACIDFITAFAEHAAVKRQPTFCVPEVSLHPNTPPPYPHTHAHTPPSFVCCQSRLETFTAACSLASCVFWSSCCHSQWLSLYLSWCHHAIPAQPACSNCTASMRRTREEE